MNIVSSATSTLGAMAAVGQEDVLTLFDSITGQSSARMLARGRRIFRHDTFGSEAFWGDKLRLHDAIKGEKNGGVGPGVSPVTALAVGLKVDVDSLSKATRDAIKQGKVDLNDPNTTLALLKEDAVVGVKGFFNRGDTDSSGVQFSGSKFTHVHRLGSCHLLECVRRQS